MDGFSLPYSLLMVLAGKSKVQASSLFPLSCVSLLLIVLFWYTHHPGEENSTIAEPAMKCLLVLSFVLLQLAYPTSSYVACGHKTPNASVNRFRLRSSGNDESDKASESTASDANFFERTVRKISRNKNYKFGDLTKNAATASSRTIEGAVRTVTRDDDYEFGDMTKKVLSTGTGTFEGAVKSITGNEEYHFGVSNDINFV